MSVKDRMLIAFRNLSAGRQMVRKIVFGMMFVFMLLLCFLTVFQSFGAYKKDFNEKHSADCYYYAEFENQELTDIWLADLLKYSRNEQERYQAKEVSVLCTLQLYDRGGVLEAGDTGLVLDGKEYRIADYFVYNRKPYQNIYGESAPIELVLYRAELSVLADKITAQYGADYLLGNYPENPGEIMLDTYILEMYGVEDAGENLLGKQVGIYCVDMDAEEVILKDYVLTGILQADVLSARESLSANDYHLEHVYINPRGEDVGRFTVSRGSIRYYFDDYAEYVKHYEKKDEILKLNLSQVYSSDNAEISLTERGVEYCLLYWIMQNMGRLLSIVAVVIGIIITFSVFYIFQFYRDRNARYLAMLQYIGMEKRDRVWIFSFEMSIMLLMATVLGIYLSALFLLLLNSITLQILNFGVVLDVKAGLAAVLLGWLYFWLCLGIVMRRTG